MKLHNTLTRQLDDFTPQRAGEVSLYTCGPTVYDYLHIGNWAAYIYWDTLVRTLQVNDYTVTRVMNITDVGHLVSDADEGEDKLEKGARREGKTAWDIAEFYTADFIEGMKQLNLVEPSYVTKATDYIPQQLELIRTLKSKGYTYQIKDGIYFDTAQFPTYADFAQLNLEAQQAGARVSYNEEKRNTSDFALWKFTPQDQARDMEWETPHDLLDNAPEQPVMGFPGWHLECSAMAMDILGETIDLHTGGIDHIPVHHTNEIAQSESASGQRFANYWLHANHLKVNGTKISKSLENGYTLQDIAQEGYSPLDLRLAVLQGHYRSEGNFTFAALQAARNRRLHWQEVAVLRHQIYDSQPDHTQHSDADLTKSLEQAERQVITALSADLDTPQALQIIDTIFSRIMSSRLRNIDRQALIDLIATIDRLLGLKLFENTPDITDEHKQLIIERQAAREQKDWTRSDAIRDTLATHHIVVRDSADGSIWQYSS